MGCRLEQDVGEVWPMVGSKSLDRLRIQPPGEDELPQGFDRLIQRVTTMMLAAVPEELRGELIATRQLSPQGILFRVLKSFQPGSL